MTPDDIPDLRLPADLRLWTPLRELDITDEEIVAELQSVTRPEPVASHEHSERQAA